MCATAEAPQGAETATRSRRSSRLRTRSERRSGSSSSSSVAAAAADHSELKLIANRKEGRKRDTNAGLARERGGRGVAEGGRG